MMTEETIQKIWKICKNIAPKYTFGIYDVEDIQQEAFAIALKALNKWDGNRPIENFVAVCISNGLCNLQRNKNNYRAYKLHNPIDMDIVCHEEHSALIREDEEKEELSDKINSKLPAEYREDYLKLLSGVPISQNRKKKIREIVAEILGG